MAKDILSTKDISIKAESIAFHLTLLYSSNRQTAFKTNPSIALISSMSKLIVFSSQITLDLSQCKRKFIQKPFAKIRQIFYTSISNSQGTEDIKIKGINKDAKRKHHYFVFFYIPKNKTRVQVYSKWITFYFSQAKVQLPINFLIKVNCV